MSKQLSNRTCSYFTDTEQLLRKYFNKLVLLGEPLWLEGTLTKGARSLGKVKKLNILICPRYSAINLAI